MKNKILRNCRRSPGLESTYAGIFFFSRGRELRVVQHQRTTKNRSILMGKPDAREGGEDRKDSEVLSLFSSVLQWRKPRHQEQRPELPSFTLMATACPQRTVFLICYLSFFPRLHGDQRLLSSLCMCVFLSMYAYMVMCAHMLASVGISVQASGQSQLSFLRCFPF